MRCCAHDSSHVAPHTPLRPSATAAVFTFLGLTILGLADTAHGRDWFVVGYALTAIGGQMTLFSVFPTAFLLPEYQTLVFATNSCLFDGSCIVFQIFSSLHDLVGLSRQTLFWSYACFCVPCYAANVALWTLASSSPELAPEPQPSPKRTGHITGSPKWMQRPDERTMLLQTPTSHADQGPQGLPPMKERDLGAQLVTPQFGFILFFAACGILRANLYIGSNEQLLMNLGGTAAAAASQQPCLRPRCGCFLLGACGMLALSSFALSTCAEHLR